MRIIKFTDVEHREVRVRAKALVAIHESYCQGQQALTIVTLKGEYQTTDNPAMLLMEWTGDYPQ